MKHSRSAAVPEGSGLVKALTIITSPQQKNRYVITGFLFSAFGFFAASIPLGTATLVIGRVLLHNRIKTWGYFFYLIGAIWMIALPLVNFFYLFKTRYISVLPPATYLFQSFRASLFR